MIRSEVRPGGARSRRQKDESEVAAWFAISSSSFCAPDGAVSSCARTDIRVSRTYKDQEAQATHQCGFFPADFDEEDGF